MSQLLSYDLRRKDAKVMKETSVKESYLSILINDSYQVVLVVLRELGTAPHLLLVRDPHMGTLKHSVTFEYIHSTALTSNTYTYLLCNL